MIRSARLNEQDELELGSLVAFSLWYDEVHPLWFMGDWSLMLVDR